MRLSDEEIRTYSEKGYLLIPSFFSEMDIKSLRDALPKIYAMQQGPIVRETDGSVRLVFGVHLWDEHFFRLARDPSLLDATQRLLGGHVYVHQSKVVAKMPQSGEGWPWHQDYVFWKKRDRMPTSRALSVIVFLDRVSMANGPVFILAGSQREDLVDEDTYSINRETIRALATRYPLEVPEGPAGSVVFLHSVVIHGSPTNISPYERTLGFVTYNRVDNAPPEFEEASPHYISSRDREPLVALPAGNSSRRDR